MPISDDLSDTLEYAKRITEYQQLEQVATYHLLSALIHDLSSDCSQSLLDAGVSLYKLEKNLKLFLDIPGQYNGKVTLSAGSKRLLLAAYKEAKERRNSKIESKHLLLAFLKKEESNYHSIAKEVLKQAKVEIELVYKRVSDYYD